MGSNSQPILMFKSKCQQLDVSSRENSEIPVDKFAHITCIIHRSAHCQIPGHERCIGLHILKILNPGPKFQEYRIRVQQNSRSPENFKREGQKPK
uniref:Uncharacterized protein n=1 Tax=Romanomermis culicivorax TaxID=13658 RepID=A0A915L541_ROMCU